MSHLATLIQRVKSIERRGDTLPKPLPPQPIGMEWGMLKNMLEYMVYWDDWTQGEGEAALELLERYGWADITLEELERAELQSRLEREQDPARRSILLEAIENPFKDAPPAYQRGAKYTARKLMQMREELQRDLRAMMGVEE